MRRSSLFILLAAGLIHLGLLAGWRWQQPLTPYFFDATVLSGGRGLDFYSIYQAGYNARHGLDIYEGDPARVPNVVPYFTPFRYLPVVAYTLGAGLSLLSPLSAYKTWVVAVELVLLLCVGLTYWHTRRQPDLFARLAAMWLVFTPFYLELFMGQFSFVQAALVFGMLLLARRLTAALQAGVPRGFDGLWIASLLWKINTVVFVPLFLRLRRFTAVFVAALAVAATTLPYFWAFPRHWRDFALNNFGTRLAGHELGNLGLRQLVYETLATVGAGPVVQQIAQAALVVAVVGLALWLTFRPGPLHVGLLLCLWLTAFFLISPQIWEHHYVMLLPVLVSLYWWRRSRVIALIWLLLALPTPFGFIGLQPVIAANHDLRAFALEPAWQLLLQHASKALPALALFGYIAVQAKPQIGLNEVV